ncbi:MAG TPA: helix-turn-helix transcriptional regulator [Fimbriimonas sp.]|nr:helix-turn-helix transcriptional regulator [Fimbriimonas sp.]
MKEVQVFATCNAAVDFPGDCLAIHFVHGGRASVVQAHRVHPLVEDGFLIQNVGTSHRLVAGDDTVTTFCIPECLIQNERFAECLTPHDLAVDRAMSHLVLASANDRSFWEKQLVASLVYARDISSQKFFLAPERQCAVGRSSEMVAAREFILSRLDEPLSVACAASHCGYSPFHFHRIFTEWHGMTPGSYILTEKIRRACRKLVLTQESVSNIAADCGFFSPTSFAGTFKKGTGYRPSGFRALAAHHRSDLAFFCCLALISCSLGAVPWTTGFASIRI